METVNPIRMVMLAAAFAALSACAGMRHPRQEASPNPPPPASKQTPPEAPSEPPPSSETAESGPPAGDASVNTAPCTCMEAKPSKPVAAKPRPRPKPVHKEAPPQLPTAPVVAETPPGGVVDAQVHSMSVSVMSILGKRVRGPNGEDLGRVVDVLADASGRVRVAIIDFGGFLGVGNHRIAVDWPLLRFNPDGKDPALLLSLTRQKLQEAPEYKENPRPQALMEPPPPEAAPAAPAPSSEGKQ
jgi:sporulation protein YlmC with PRC-barrel domain